MLKSLDAFAILAGVRFRLTPFVLSFAVALCAGLTSEPAHAGSFTEAIACCDNAANPSSCWVPESPDDLTECDPAAEMALCSLADDVPVECAPIDLECCPVIAGVVMIDECLDFSPGFACAGVVVAVTPELGQCCRCLDGDTISTCEVALSESCQSGWDFGPFECKV